MAETLSWTGLMLPLPAMWPKYSSSPYPTKHLLGLATSFASLKDWNTALRCSTWNSHVSLKIPISSINESANSSNPSKQV
jgi:hypothetical protein